MYAPGVYSIQHVPTGRLYIGSAKSVAKRWTVHVCMLRKGTHHSKFLQRCWDKGKDEDFVWRVLVLCRDTELLLYEQIALDRYLPEFNTCKTARSTMGIPASDKAKSFASERMLRRIAADPNNHKVVTEKANKRTRELYADPEYRDWHKRKMQEHGETLQKYITFNGETKSKREWAESLGVTRTTLHHRIQKWGIEAALTQNGTGKNTRESLLLRSRRRGATHVYNGEEMTMTEIADLLGVTRQALLYQKKRKGVEAAIAHFEAHNNG